MMRRPWTPEGQYREALPWFASLVEGGMRILNPYQVPSLVRRAQIYEQLGDQDKAAEFYRRFIKLWENADAEGQPVVEEARESLDRLIESGLREPLPG